MTHRARLGITMIEILAVMFIVATVLLLSVVGFSRFLATSRLTQASEDIVSALREAKEKTLARENDTVYGVHFTANQFTLFSGGVYAASDPENVVHSMPNGYAIAVISLSGGGSDVMFQSITGETPHAGDIILEKTAGSFQPSSTIHIYETGTAEIQ